MNATRTNTARISTRSSRRNLTANRYPNAASKSYFLEKLADTALCSASCVGIVTILFFLATMF